MTAPDTALGRTDTMFLPLAHEPARIGYAEGGCPIGGGRARGAHLVARGRDRRVQDGDPIARGEIAAPTPRNSTGRMASPARVRRA